MKAKKQPRFDIDALRALAGEKVFARAEAYFRAGQVEILSIEPEKRTITNIFKAALIKHPALLFDVARAFMTR